MTETIGNEHDDRETGTGTEHETDREPEHETETERDDHDGDTLGEDNPSKAVAQYSELWWEIRSHNGRCKARSSRTGNRCKRPKWAGAAVCGHHGAKAPGVRRKARQRLEEATDLMARELLKMAADDSVSDAVKLRAITEALDRGNVGTKVEIEVGEKPIDLILEGMANQLETTSRAEYRRRQGINDDSDFAPPPALAGHEIVDAEVVSEPHTSRVRGQGQPDARRRFYHSPGEPDGPGIDHYERAAEVNRAAQARRITPHRALPPGRG